MRPWLARPIGTSAIGIATPYSIVCMIGLFSILHISERFQWSKGATWSLMISLFIVICFTTVLETFWMLDEEDEQID